MNDSRMSDDGSRRYAGVFVDAYSIDDPTTDRQADRAANVDTVVYASGAADVRINGQQVHTVGAAPAPAPRRRA